MSANPLPRLTTEEYLSLDRASEWKSEFHDGDLFPIEAVSYRHSTIAANLIFALKARLRAAACSIQPGPLRVRVTASKYLYPDLQIVCGKPELTDEHADTLINPTIVIEILSPSTADYDHGAKFELYRSLPSLQECVLVSQSEPKVEVFTKNTEHTWSLTIVDSLNEPVRLQSVGIEVLLAELFDGVEVE